MEALVYIPVLLLSISPALFALAQYNTLIARRNRVRETWNRLDAQLTRRCDLVPELVATARAFAGVEPALLAQVTAARDRCAGNRGAVSRRVPDEAALVGALRTFLPQAGAHPGLRSDAAFQRLHAELAAHEDGIQTAQRFYNDAVHAYRKKSEAFPGRLVARAFSFPTVAFFPVKSAAAPEHPVRKTGRDALE